MTDRGGPGGLARLLRRWPSPPIAVQILALLLAALVVAQTVTLGLTVLLPPAPPMHHSLADIAAGLRVSAPANEGDRPLVRTVEVQPPSLQSPGWVASERAGADLARLLNVPREDVRLLFYAPPPFAGAETRRPGPPPLALLFTSYAEAQTLPAGPGPGGVACAAEWSGQWVGKWPAQGAMAAGGVQMRQGFSETPYGGRAARAYRFNDAGAEARRAFAYSPAAAEAARSGDPFRSRAVTLPDSLRRVAPSSPPLDPIADAVAREPTLRRPPPPQPLAQPLAATGSSSRSRPRPPSPWPRPPRADARRSPKRPPAAPCPRPRPAACSAWPRRRSSRATSWPPCGWVRTSG
jgi:two-component system OmpR family sensor kinase